MASRARVSAGVLMALTALALGAAGARALDTEGLRRLAADGHPEEALERLEAELAASPGDAEGRFLQGVLLVELGRASEAEAAFTDLIRSHPELPEPYNNLAVIQAASGRYDEAVETLRRALATHSSYQTAYENLTRIGSRLEGGARAVELVLLADLADGGIPAARAVAEPGAPAGGASVERPASPAAELEAGEAEEILGRVRAWADSWSDGRGPEHLALYSDAFRPAAGEELAEWTAARLQALAATGPEGISVAVLDSRKLGPGLARIRFLQSPAGGGGTVTRSLDLAREAGGWKIVADRVEP